MRKTSTISAILVEENFTGGRANRTVIDTETGEKVASEWSGGLRSFRDDFNAAILTVMLSREVSERGADYYYIRDMETDEIITSYYASPRPKKGENPKHSGGKKTYTGFRTELMEKAFAMPDQDVGSIMKFAHLADWKTGVLMDKAKKKPHTFTSLMRALGYSHGKLAQRIAALKQAGVVEQTDDGYFISKEYIGVRGF